MTSRVRPQSAAAVLLLIALMSIAAAAMYSSNRVVPGEFLVKLADGDANLREVARDLGVSHLEPVARGLDNWYIARVSASRFEKAHAPLLEDVEHFAHAQASFLGERHGVREFVPNYVRQHMSKKLFTDPQFESSWHIQNTGSITNSVAGMDINVNPSGGAWDQNISGAGKIIGYLDDGILDTLTEFSGRVRTDLCWNFGPNTTACHSGVITDKHGTFVSGLSVANGNNSLCTVGAAYGAQVTSFSGFTTEATTAQALLIYSSVINVINWSQGFAGCVATKTCRLDTWTGVVRDAINSVGTNGAGGKGISIFPAASNEGDEGGDTAMSSYCGGGNFGMYSGCVAALNVAGKLAFYSNFGAAVLVSAPGGDSNTPSGGNGTLWGNSFAGTADQAGYQCTSNGQQGTSYAAPLVSAVAALILEANSALTSRDVFDVMIRSARKNDATDGNWRTNGAGLPFNYLYGFGLVDATAAVNRARTHTLLSASNYASPPTTATVAVGSAVPDAGSTTANVTYTPSSTQVVEQVILTITLSGGVSGQMKIELISPAGTVSNIFTPLSGGITLNSAFTNWPMRSFHFWGENPAGTWTVRVSDVVAGGATMTFTDFKLAFAGRNATQTSSTSTTSTSTTSTSTSSTSAASSLGGALFF